MRCFQRKTVTVFAASKVEPSSARDGARASEIVLFYVQPLLAKYRQGVIDSLSKRFSVSVLASTNNSGSTEFGECAVGELRLYNSPSRSIFNNRLRYQANVLGPILKARPDVILACANPRDITFWILLLLSRVLGIRCFAHGQGAFAYPKSHWVRRLMYRSIVRLSTSYICYTQSCAGSLLALGCESTKISLADNALVLNAVVRPEEKTYREAGVLFIGRLRPGCRLDHLVEAVRVLRKRQGAAHIHVVGDGVLAAQYRSEFASCDWITWHGALHDDFAIAAVSRSCRIGCYPGDAGLSVVHLFGLSLPLIIHGEMSRHMGPEPSYVEPDWNGYLFEPRDSAEALAAKLAEVYEGPRDVLRAVGTQAFATYTALSSPSTGDKMVQIIAAAKDPLEQRRGIVS